MLCFLLLLPCKLLNFMNEKDSRKTLRYYNWFLSANLNPFVIETTTVFGIKHTSNICRYRENYYYHL